MEQDCRKRKKNNFYPPDKSVKNWRHDATESKWSRVEQNQWIHSSSRAENTAIKDKGSRYRCYSGDRPSRPVRTQEEERKTTVRFIHASHLFCTSPVKLFLFSNHSSFAFTSVSRGEQPVPPPLINTGCFLEQNRVLLKTCSYSQHGCWRQTALRIHSSAPN